MKKTKRFVCASLAVSLLAIPVFSMPCMAGENITGKSGTGYSAEEWESLTDNVLEYDEIGRRIKEFNPDIVDAWENIQDAQDELFENIDELEGCRNASKSRREDSENLNQYENYAVYYTNELILDSVIDSLTASAQGLMCSTSTRRSVGRGVAQLEKAVQSLVISYDSLRRTNDTLAALKTMKEKNMELVQKKYDQGMATGKELLAAQSDIISAKQSAAALQSGISALKPAILRMCGYGAGADVEIAAVPAADISAVDSLFSDDDLEKAIGNNVTLISYRTSEAGKTSSGIAARLDKIEEGEKKLAIQLDSLKEDVISKKYAYLAALDGYEAAKADREKYRRMQELGYLSETDFIGTEVAWYSADASFAAADTGLRQAMETYAWAVKGYVEIE